MDAPQSLLDKTSYLSDAARARLCEAYALAEAAHRGVTRRSGEPYITHPVAVTELLAEMHLDVDALIAGLLHDTVEDTDVTFEEIEARFGAPVRRIVEGETKISKLKIRQLEAGAEEEQAENLRQMLLAMVGDVRIILVKLADRLHNMRTLRHMPPEKQRRIARETLEIFAPLAHRLGINHIKSELEELGFFYLEPERYRALQRQVRMRRAEREAYVQRSIALLEERLAQEGLTFEISGRSKGLYSVYRKMQRDAKNLDQIFDLMAIRAILTPTGGGESVEDEEKAICYRALGIIHSIWTPIPGRFKDYVAVPKPNGYQSLHTTVIGLQGQPIEVQIRTRRMHEIAEYGVAAHWAYKQGFGDPSQLQARLTWMKQLLDVNNTAESAGAFIDTVKSDFLSERVLVFTPAGDVVNLPLGSTPIDFAYHVHTEVGHRCIGARVNGEIVPLSYALQTGDRVEILTNRGAQYGPSPDWLSIAVTRGAKQKIRHYFRQQEREGVLESAKRTLERALRRKNLSVAHYTGKKLEVAAKKLLNADSVDELYLALHAKRLTTKQILAELVPSTPKGPDPKTPPKARHGTGGIYVDGLDAPAKLAQCCSPVRGDDVVGYVTRGRGVTVHRYNCPNVKHLLRKESERLVNVTWDAPSGEVYPVDFEVIGVDRPGLLMDVLDVIASMNKSASRVTADVQDSTSARIHFRIDVKDQSEVDRVKDTVLRIADVTRIYRSRPGLKV
ncbi:RelA/SpoT family protein [Truepera radiovictrix]|uniref:(P)ppGpp synthetase I, SpoT/RelA n=1 Tax=Truepera radiovictrix (strain DSM 17093 / CIP 108686 / LMG 22925 / RQ-24) TaxID=649638 RepID=D7CVB0_TRURR|nr:bifunctional (p)ppGpp synthetase/guanosine-3',5'-bis(diphosphate) 3'-pyrophosphohydrolase [Truepera radiovictrix]ADI14138.1 (p)ppGpp synthetase I, SpoT/RelA [Truepera radiovictrix DSM 17093]WMT57300.1 bifunctional (p)ppGpp synthetase/guanosine-3',5'-bis(diphosphate) 3'-pyrophosphohydrolase [Truepera radiovictrix]